MMCHRAPHPAGFPLRAALEDARAARASMLCPRPSPSWTSGPSPCVERLMARPRQEPRVERRGPRAVRIDRSLYASCVRVLLRTRPLHPSFHAPLHFLSCLVSARTVPQCTLRYVSPAIRCTIRFRLSAVSVSLRACVRSAAAGPYYLSPPGCWISIWLLIWMSDPPVPQFEGRSARPRWASVKGRWDHSVLRLVAQETSAVRGYGPANHRRAIPPWAGARLRGICKTRLGSPKTWWEKHNEGCRGE
ncbi:hypothetical protein C8Q80DRAFT_755198 [Daedaleopsis nitida]|nr:hypothetical protein C8Q80DRAFT_755198 [Daedaleopsis nitida]